MGPYEDQIAAKLKSTFVTEKVAVLDRSGGCGASFEITIKSKIFKDVSKIQQHRMVQAALGDETKKWHAVSFQTSVD